VSSAALRPDPHDDYVELCRGVLRLAKVDLSQYKRPQMERRIRSFAARKGVADLGDYLEELERDEAELNAFLDRMTINVSQLWRNPEQWDLLRKTVIPELVSTGNGSLRIWSAGCSYGAEAYTLAATCLESAPGVRCQIVGTDIDRRVIERAREGVFDRDDARTAPAASLRRFFVEDGGWWRAGEELRQRISFDVGDLLQMRVQQSTYDLVLCRNVVIYFNEDVRDALHARIAASLRPGGHLMVGSTERVAQPAALDLAFAHPFTYRKR
jgi:chemotaxis protein methyltransferase CheR